MKVIILGAGLSGLSLAFFLQNNPQVDEIELIEQENVCGGLCRSIKKDGYLYDIGPHVLFSKDKEALSVLESVLEDKNVLRRSNQIIYKGRHVQFPFENDLSKLPEEDLRYCVRTFVNNPYRDYTPQNMLQHFLWNFGEGITNTYLRPYNEKIWKFDPAFMDTQMVERIPHPTDEEIMRSAKGETVDGYLHQLYFYYPSSGGTGAVVHGFEKKLNAKCHIELNSRVTSVERKSDRYEVHEDNGSLRQGDVLVSTIPIHVMSDIYSGIDDKVKDSIYSLRYNSLMLFFVKTKEDLAGEHTAFYVPNREVIFHRISKMDFFGEAYKSDSATYMVEVTFRKGDYIDVMSENELSDKIRKGITIIGFSRSENDVDIINVTKHEYAYVIYDLAHKKNMSVIRDYFTSQGVFLHGRFGNFEYWNMDRIVRESISLSERIFNQ